MIEISTLSTIPVEDLSLEDSINTAISGVFSFFNKNQSTYSIAIRITDNAEIQNLNKMYRNLDKPTDILSFTAEEFDPETGLIHLGDIVISHQKILLQAQEAKHTPQTEYSLLVVHGMLHLFGYDHSDPDEKKEMWKLQKDILASLDIFPNKLPE